MYGSTDRKRLRTRTWLGPRVPSSRVMILKSSGVGVPTGRRTSWYSRALLMVASRREARAFQLHDAGGELGRKGRLLTAPIIVTHYDRLSFGRDGVETNAHDS